MDRILFVNACVRPQSRTLALARAALSQLQGEIEEVCLEEAHIQPLDNAALEARTLLAQAKRFEAPVLRWARQFSEADEIVIAAPYWDLAFPACLKAYLEAVCVPGVTFRYDKRGVPMSLCCARRLIYITTAGGPIFGENLGYSYITALAKNYFAIRDLRYFDARCLDVAGVDVQTMLHQAEREIVEGLR